jgi:hypothetical protein
MNGKPYEAMLNGSDGANFGGEPLQQGIVTDTCYVNRQEIDRRAQSDQRSMTTMYDKDFDTHIFRVFEHELCLTFIDNLSHAPMLFGNYGAAKHNGLSNKARAAYEKAGCSSTKLATYPQVFSALNKVGVNFGQITNEKVTPDQNSTPFPTYNTYKAFFTTWPILCKGLGISDDYAGYFPDPETFFAHFAFKCIGTAKTNDHVPEFSRFDIPVNIGGRVHPFATQQIFPGQPVEWYLPTPGELPDYDKIVAETGNNRKKIIVGLRPSLYHFAEAVSSALITPPSNPDDSKMMQTYVEGLKLSMAVSVFMKSRVLGKALKYSEKGVRCDLALSKGPYCA